jgi:hypothetical protein
MMTTNPPLIRGSAAPLIDQIESENGSGAQEIEIGARRSDTFACQRLCVLYFHDLFVKKY